jgi:hypothetical protein
MPSIQRTQDKSQLLYFLDNLLPYCLEHKISDLHFEPQGTLRLRKNLVLQPYTNIPTNFLNSIVQRFKVLAKLDIAEHRLPQDGQFIWMGPHPSLQIPCRISCCPTLNGQKVVIRLMTRQHLKLNWDSIGLPQLIQDKLESYCMQTDGFILICGPTGSGKTTTLYTLLEKLNNGDKHIISIEDPIEIPFLNFTQIEVQPKLGFNLNLSLRTVLRQDPDIIMIGEIRDEETANLCLHASQTGHVVLSCLHANNPFGAILRLQQLGVHPNILAYHLKMIVSQHLVKSVCTNCQSGNITPSPPFCNICHQGINIKVNFQVLEITPTFQENMLSYKHLNELYAAFKNETQSIY